MQVDDKLICKLLVGHDDSPGMEVLFNSYYRPLVLWADSFLGDIPAAEDLVQDFFVAFWEQRAYARITSGNLRGYLFASVRNRALKLLEKRDPLREACGELNENAEVEDTDWLTEEILQAIEAEIEKLPPRTREVLKSVYLDGLELPGDGRSFFYLDSDGKNVARECFEVFEEGLFRVLALQVRMNLIPVRSIEKLNHIFFSFNLAKSLTFE